MLMALIGCGDTSITSNAQESALLGTKAATASATPARNDPKVDLKAFENKYYFELAKASPVYNAVLKADTPEAGRLFEPFQNGVNAPGQIITMGDRSILYFSNCIAHNCASTVGFVLIDLKSGEMFAKVVKDGTSSIIVNNQGLAAIALSNCDEHDCLPDNYTPAPPSADIDIQPITAADKSWAEGGYSCEAIDEKGRVVLYTEGPGVIRVNGRAIRFTENDTVGGILLNVDDGSATVMLDDINKPKVSVDYEVTEQKRLLSVSMGDKAEMIDVILRCAS